MIVVGFDHVGGGDRLAIVEGEALAQLEYPFGGAVRRFERFGQMRLHGVLLVDMGQLRAKYADRHVVLEVVGPGGGIKSVGGGAMAGAQPERAALLGLGARGAHEQGIGGGKRQAGAKRSS